MSRLRGCLGGPLFRFPRVSGDEPKYADDTVYELAFSPRERG